MYTGVTPQEKAELLISNHLLPEYVIYCSPTGEELQSVAPLVHGDCSNLQRDQNDPVLTKIFLGQVGKAVLELVEHGIIHCDIKPDNILYIKTTKEVGDNVMVEYYFFLNDYGQVGKIRNNDDQIEQDLFPRVNQANDMDDDMSDDADNDKTEDNIFIGIATSETAFMNTTLKGSLQVNCKVIAMNEPEVYITLRSYSALFFASYAFYLNQPHVGKEFSSKNIVGFRKFLSAIEIYDQEQELIVKLCYGKIYNPIKLETLFGEEETQQVENIIQRFINHL